jgi:hypothetical protein
MSKRSRVLAAVAAAGVLAVVGLSSAQSAGATPYTNRPTLKVTGGTYVVLHYIAVTGDGYVPGENVSIAIDVATNVQEVVRADATGHFVTNVLLPDSIGYHTIIGTGQFANNGYDVAKVKVLVVLRLLAGGAAFDRPLAGPGPSIGTTESPGGGLAVVLGIAGAAIIALGSGAYILVSVRRRTTGR